jgi:hypothetical protein
MVITNLLYKTNPLIIHNPLADRGGEEWIQCVRKATKKSQAHPCSDVSLCTWNSSTTHGLLEINLLNRRMTYACLGRGIKNWTNRLKIPLTLEFVKTVRTKYIIALDCYDVLVLGEIEEIIDRFRKTGAEILFNATGTNYPSCQRNKEIEEKICVERPFNFLNSGAFIANRDYLEDFLSDVNSYEDEYTMRYKSSDQIKYKPLYYKRYPDVRIDSTCEIFQIMFLEGGNISNIVSTTAKML